MSTGSAPLDWRSLGFEYIPTRSHVRWQLSVFVQWRLAQEGSTEYTQHHTPCYEISHEISYSHSICALGAGSCRRLCACVDCPVRNSMKSLGKPKIRHFMVLYKGKCQQQWCGCLSPMFWDIHLNRSKCSETLPRLCNFGMFLTAAVWSMLTGWKGSQRLVNAVCHPLL